MNLNSVIMLQSLNILYKSVRIKDTVRLTIKKENAGFQFFIIPVDDEKNAVSSSDGKVYKTAIDILQHFIDEVNINNIMEITVSEDECLITAREIRAIVGGDVKIVTILI